CAADVATPSYEQAVSSWAAHLRAGGTTPWSGWVPTGDVTVLHPLPDAIHLELVRRINLAAGPDASGLGALADRVLATASPGRGLLDVPLPWPGTPHRFGTPARDPGSLPEDELVRLATGVLAHLLPDVRRPPAPVPRTRWPVPWRRRFMLHGSPATVAAVRRSLLAQGLVETPWRTTHVVIARPVEVMMAEHWAETVRNGGILKWSAIWRRAEAAGRLPGPIDVTAIADRLQGRRREGLHVVVAREAGTAAALAAEVLRARPPALHGTGDAALSDLLRRLNRLTALTQGPAQVRDLSRTLVTVLDESTADSGDRTQRVVQPVVPPSSLPWAREVAAASTEALRHAGYAVHGEPDALAPTDHGLPGIVDRERTLELAVTACLRIWPQGG
ncbi:MAG: hypothetical protein ABWX73_08955, partial [Marmoricola sp.]